MPKSFLLSLRALLSLFALLVAGCASLDGRGLVPGQSSEADVVSTMGTPALTLERAGGGRLLYFSRLPYGRQIYKASIGSDGALQSLEPSLTPANIRGFEVDKATRDQVRERLGPPYRITRAPFKPLEVWEYPWRIMEDRRILWLSFSDDSLLRDVIEMHDFQSDPASGRGKSR